LVEELSGGSTSDAIALPAGNYDVYLLDNDPRGTAARFVGTSFEAGRVYDIIAAELPGQLEFSVVRVASPQP
jgi:cellulose biosynthesis protein BcsQ